MSSTGTVRVGFCLVVVIAVPLAGWLYAAELGGPPPEALLASDSAPLPLVAAAPWEAFSAVPLSYLPGHDWGLPAPLTPPSPPPERSEGLTIEIGGDYANRYEYRDAFAEDWHREDATIDGLSALRWDRDGPALELVGSAGRRRVSLVYRFASPYAVKDVVAELAGEIAGGGDDRVELALSSDGKRFGHAVGAFGRGGGHRFHLTTHGSARFHACGFWVRITGELSAGSRVSLACFRMATRVKPPKLPEIALQPAGERRLGYHDTFRSQKMLHLAEIDNADALAWHRGRVGLRGHEGQPSRVVVRQKFVSPEPLRSVAVRIRNAAGRGGPRNHFALSLDGRTLLAAQATPDGAFDGLTELRLDPKLLGDARQFYVHMMLAGNGGDAPASVVSDLQVEALAAEPPTATAAAPTTAPTRD